MQYTSPSFTSVPIIELNGKGPKYFHRFCSFLLSRWPLLVLHLEQGTASLRAKAAYLPRVNGNWKGLLIEENRRSKSKSSKSSKSSNSIEFHWLRWGRMELQRAWFLPQWCRQTWPELLNVSNNFHKRICLELYSRLLQKMIEIMFEYVWCWNLKPSNLIFSRQCITALPKHLTGPLNLAIDSRAISNEDGPDRSKDLTRGSHGQSCGPTLQKYGWARHGPTHLYSYMADMPRVFDKTFFSALDCRRNLHNTGESSGGIRGIQHMRWTRRCVTTQNYQPSEAIWSLNFAPMFATMPISIVLFGSDIHRCLVAAAGGRNRLRLKTARSETVARETKPLWLGFYLYILNLVDAISLAWWFKHLWTVHTRLIY